jgi:hypothetical protein
MISKALFVGIDTYNSKDMAIDDLKGCVSDMFLMKETLTHVLGALPKDTVILTDQNATTRNILNSLQHIVEGLKPGEQVFMYYAGHGGQVPNASQSEEDLEAYDQMLVPHDFSKTEPLLDDIINYHFSRIPNDSKLIMILDSCHAGGMARSMTYSRDYELEEWTSRSIGIISRAEYSPAELKKLREYKHRFIIERSERNFILLAAAQPHEFAWERSFNGKSHGIFTYHICELLKENGINESPVNLINYAYSKIMTYRENQMPRLIGNENFFHKPVVAQE